MDDNRRTPHRRRAIFRCIAVGVSLCCAVLVAEVAVRAFSTQGFSLLVKDAVVGQRYRPLFDGSVFVPEAGRKVHLRFNDLGYRGPDVPEKKPAGVRRVAVLGDSFVAAVAVDEDKTMSAQLEQQMNRISRSERWEVLNFGVSGNSTGQSLLTWRNFAQRFQPDLVVLCFYNGNDLAENKSGISSAHRPYFDLDDQGQLRQEELSEGRATLSRWLAEHSHLYVWQKHRMRLIRDRFRNTANVLPPGYQVLNASPPEQFQQAWKVTEAIIATLAREVEQSGAELVLVSIPAHEQLYSQRWRQLLETVGPDDRERFDRDYPERRLAEICREHDIPFLPLVQTFRQSDREELHFQSEGHWTEVGNELAADAVLDFVATHRIAGFAVETPLRR